MTMAGLLSVLVLLVLAGGGAKWIKAKREAQAAARAKGGGMSLLGASANAKARDRTLYTSKDFQSACLELVQKRLYRQAIQACDKFTAQADLAPRANSTIAALYTARVINDLPSSVTYAARAARQGDARGKFILAAHMLSGAFQPYDERLLRQLLIEAKQGGVSAASTYIQALQESQTCRVTTKAMPMGLPIFCMFRAELQQALRQKGLRLKDEDLRQWQDSFAPGDMLASARDALLQFDVDPREEIFRVARWSYQLEDEKAQQRWDDLEQSLTRKYGKPKLVAAQKELLWDMGDGTVVRLMREDTWQLAVSYESPARLKGRAEHLTAVDQVARQDRVLAEAEAL
jgi:hypothetical protein